MSSRADPQNIASYYDVTHHLYQVFWSRHGLHYGLWDGDVQNLQDAIRRTDAFVGERLGLPRGARVLDAGCGVGGTSRTLARTRGYQLSAVTLSRRQVETARRRNRREGVDGLITVEEANFTRLPYADATFDGVFSVEATCHAEHKIEALREYARVLRPGGRLVIVDGFKADRALRYHEQRDLDAFLLGWEVHSLATPRSLAQDAHAVGLEPLPFEDLTEQVQRTAKHMYRLAQLCYVPVGLPARAGLLPRRWYDHGMACFAQRRLLAGGGMVYGCLVATRA